MSTHYQEQGYVVLKDVIKDDAIEAYLDAIQSEVSKKSFNYVYTQHKHTYERLRHNTEGLLEDSIQNPHAYPWSKKVRDAVLNIICDDAVLKQLADAADSESNFAIWQSMYFDKSTGTLPHQDSYYLDTDPYGGVIGIWFALEDISIEAGPFYVIRGSDRAGVMFEECRDRARYMDHDQFTEKMIAYEAQNTKNVVPLLAEKGDIVIWNSTLVHGALSQRSPTASRKSLTAHYFPVGAKLKFFDEVPKLTKPPGHNVPVMGYLSKYGANKAKGRMLLKVCEQALKGLGPEMDMRRKAE
jgi:phytanoyl-CoA hydroxylase